MAEKLGSAILELKTSKKGFQRDLRTAKKQTQDLDKTFGKLKTALIAAFSAASTLSAASSCKPGRTCE